MYVAPFFKLFDAINNVHLGLRSPPMSLIAITCISITVSEVARFERFFITK